MEEIYWITRLGVLYNFLGVMIVTSFAGAIIAIIGKNIYDWDIKYAKRFLVAFVIASIAANFVPSKQDLLLIYGLGGTIDYMQSNDKAKELPDKCVELLSEWMENEKNK